MGHQMMLTVCGEREGGLDVLGGEFGELLENLAGAHPRGEPAQHVIDRNAHMPDARLPSPLSGLDRDALVSILHGGKLFAAKDRVKGTESVPRGGRLRRLKMGDGRWEMGGVIREGWPDRDGCRLCFAFAGEVQRFCDDRWRDQGTDGEELIDLGLQLGNDPGDLRFEQDPQGADDRKLECLRAVACGEVV